MCKKPTHCVGFFYAVKKYWLIWAKYSIIIYFSDTKKPQTFLKLRLLKLLWRSKYGAPGGTRTHTLTDWNLNPARLPISPLAQGGLSYNKNNKIQRFFRMHLSVISMLTANPWPAIRYGLTSIVLLGLKPYTSGAYMASTRVAGSLNVPA